MIVDVLGALLLAVLFGLGVLSAIKYFETRGKDIPR
jgi:hypothetical protein